MKKKITDIFPLEKCHYPNFNKKICVLTNGCPENRIDGASMQEFFQLNGWKVTSEFRDADIIFFNTCGLTQYQEKRSIGIIKRIKNQKKPSVELVICGCLPKINKNSLRDIHHISILGSDENEQLKDIFKYEWKAENISTNFLLPLIEPNKSKWLYLSFKEQGILVTLIRLLTIGYWNQARKTIHVLNSYTYPIKVSTGCLGVCSFCAVQLSRGKLKSKPKATVIKEFEKGLEKGYKEFALIGTDIGSYGREQGTNLVTLLKDLLKKNGDFIIKLRNIQPRFLIEMLPGLYECFKSGKISYINTAVQSGNNRILRLMKRGYCIEDLKKAIRTINTEYPEIQIRTQLMVGFPSETEEEFTDTVRLLDEVRFDYVEVYLFQARPGTKAMKMENQIPKKVARKRYIKLFIKSLHNQKRRKKERKLQQSSK